MFTRLIPPSKRRIQSPNRASYSRYAIERVLKQHATAEPRSAASVDRPYYLMAGIRPPR